MKDWSEYTLISFGDSFTFGQDTVPTYDISDKDICPVQKQYKIDCNNLSYTKILADNLGFKDTLNFGGLAGSNERSLTLLESFLRTNPEKKVFVLFSFTSASRFLQYFKVDGKREYDAINMIPNVEAREWISEERYTNINARSIIEHYTYWRNSIQDVYNHVKDRRMLYYMLSSNNVPHATFDILNDTDYRMLRNNPLEYILSNDGFGIEFMYNDDKNYVLKEMDYFKSYYKELVDKSPLLSHIGIDLMNEQRNLVKYLYNKAKFEHNDTDYYSAMAGGHWNIEGHIEVAKLIESFINDKYYD